MIDLGNVEFISKSHLRYENGEVVQGLQICGRGINIEKNINGCKGYKIPNGVGYIVTIFDLEGEHPVWGTNVIVTPKPMKIISQSSDKIILRGYMVEAQTPFGFMEVDLTDYGNQYYKSDLNEKAQYTILTPKDAAKVFFQHLKSEIDDYISKNNLSRNIKYAVSIPASFEANQRKDLIEVLKFAGISVDNQCLIDEPNAAFLSYIVETNTNPNNTKLFVPENDRLHILVFDFGAGTCDISILEIENTLGLKSKNLSISRFENHS